MKPFLAAKLLTESRRRSGLTQAELARRAGTSQPAVNRYERGLVVPSLPTLERLLRACGRELALSSRPIEARRSPSALRGPRGALLRRRRLRLLRAAERRGARDLRVFGSVARGEDTARSDVDLLIDLEPGRTLVDLAGLRREAEEILGAPVDVATPELLKDRVRESALAEAVAL